MNKNIFFVSLLAFAVYLAISIPYYSGDVKNHLVWAKSIAEMGTMGFYEREFHDFAFPNYPPVVMLLFFLSYKFYLSVNALAWLLNLNFSVFPSRLIGFFQWENVEIAFLKLPAIVSTILIGVIFNYLLNTKKERKVLYVLLFLFNPAIIYLSAIWGQFEALPMMFFLVALALLFKDRFYWSVIFCVLALLSKQTVILFWIVYLVLIFQKYGLIKLIQAIVLTMAIFYISYLPFHSPSLTWPFELYKLNFNLVAQETSVNALNLWGVLYDFKRYPDTAYFLGLTLQNWGYLAFIVSFLVISIYFFKNLFRQIITNFKLLVRGNPGFEGINREKLFIYFLNISLVYYFFLTRMHERYFFPALVFLPLLLSFGKKYWLGFVYFSALYFINLYRGLYQPDIKVLVLLVDSVVFLKMMVLGYFALMVYYIFVFLKLDKSVS